MRRVMMIAGPNGAGKTTMAESILAGEKGVFADFLNADKIAQGLSPLRPESMNDKAGRLMLERLRACLKEKVNFAFESTAAGVTYANRLREAKKNGYEVNLVYLWLSSPDLAVQRVAQRVKQGGHNVPEEHIIRRYYRGLYNLIGLYLPLADTVLVIDNSLIEVGARKVIAKKEVDTELDIKDNESWKKILVAGELANV